MASAATSTKSHARFRWGAENVLPPAENLMSLIENNTDPQRITRQQMVRPHCFRFIVIPFLLGSKLPPNYVSATASRSSRIGPSTFLWCVSC